MGETGASSGQAAACAVCKKPIVDELTVRMRDRRTVHLLCWQPSIPSGDGAKPADARAADAPDLGV